MTDQSPGDLVRTCLEALQAADSEKALALLDPDLEWRNSGLPTLRGKRAHEALLAMEQRGVGFAVEIHHLAEDGPFVLTDRTDVLSYGRFSTAFWVCGTFEVRDGRIVLWDDHFSMRNLLVGTLVGLARAVRPGQARSGQARSGQARAATAAS